MEQNVFQQFCPNCSFVRYWFGKWRRMQIEEEEEEEEEEEMT